MYASVLQVEVLTGKLDEAVRIYNESQTSHTQAAAGSRGFLMLVDRAANRALAIGIWDSEEAAHKFDTKTHHRDFGPLHADETTHDVIATAFPAGDGAGGLPEYESIIARFAGVFAGAPHRTTYEVGATAGGMDSVR